MGPQRVEPDSATKQQPELTKMALLLFQYLPGDKLHGVTQLNIGGSKGIARRLIGYFDESLQGTLRQSLDVYGSGGQLAGVEIAG